MKLFKNRQKAKKNQNLPCLSIDLNILGRFENISHLIIAVASPCSATLSKVCHTKVSGDSRVLGWPDYLHHEIKHLAQIYQETKYLPGPILLSSEKCKRPDNSQRVQLEGELKLHRSVSCLVIFSLRTLNWSWTLMWRSRSALERSSSSLQAFGWVRSHAWSNCFRVSRR